MNPDARWLRFIAILVLVFGLLVGRALFRKQASTVSAPSDYTEQIEDFNGSRTR
jgi:hypothetical protein